jgi:hypothetical protein
MWLFPEMVDGKMRQKAEEEYGGEENSRLHSFAP